MLILNNKLIALRKEEKRLKPLHFDNYDDYDPLKKEWVKVLKSKLKHIRTKVDWVPEIIRIAKSYEIPSNTKIVPITNKTRTIAIKFLAKDLGDQGFDPKLFE